MDILNIIWGVEDSKCSRLAKKAAPFVWRTHSGAGGFISGTASQFATAGKLNSAAVVLSCLLSVELSSTKNFAKPNQKPQKEKSTARNSIRVVFFPFFCLLSV